MLCSLLLTMSFSWVVTFFELLCMFQIPGGSTDCTLPITWATENGKAVDVFIILTNNPLWTFTASPVETLKKHRQVCTTFRYYYYCCCYIIYMCNVVVILFLCALSAQTSGRHSKLVMCGLTSIGHTMPDTGDRGLLSICGFDLGAFCIIRNLAQDLIWKCSASDWHHLTAKWRDAVDKQGSCTTMGAAWKAQIQFNLFS